MQRFEEWVEELFAKGDVNNALREILKLYDTTPIVSRDDPVKALRNAYHIVNRTGKVFTLTDKDDKLLVFNKLRFQLKKKYMTDSAPIEVDEKTSLSELSKYICMSVNDYGKPCIPISEIAQYVRDNSSDTLSVLRYLTGFVLGSSVYEESTECRLLVNLAGIYVMGLGIPMVLNPDFVKTPVKYRCDIYELGRNFFMERSVKEIIND